jgi:hypothetical protein
MDRELLGRDSGTGRVPFDYQNTATLDCPNVLNIGIKGDPKAIFDAVNVYFENRSGSDYAGEADLDGDGQSEKVFLCSFRGE